METVELSLDTDKWEIVPISIPPGETKEVALPHGKIPKVVILSWDEAPQKNISSLIYLNSINSNYEGDILFTIFDMHVSRPKVEAVDLSKLEISEEEDMSPDNVPKK